jgi:transposase-like protein
MAFRYSTLGQLVAADPAKAAAQLRRKFRAHQHNHTDVAAALGVDRATLRRWRARLVEAGQADPCEGKRAPRTALST